MSRTGKSLHPKKGAVMVAVVAGVSVAVLIGMTINSTVARNAFPLDVVHPEKSVSVIIPSNAYDPNGNATFSPREITVALGVNNTVIWENHSPNPERVIGTYETMPGGFGEIKGLIPSGGSWAFTFTEPGVYEYLSDIHPWLRGTVIVKELGSEIKIEDHSQATVHYGFDNNGSVLPCIVTAGINTSAVKIYMENTMGPDAVVDFSLSAKNADVSLDPSSGFMPSSNKTITVLEGTAYYPQTFYIRPHANVDYLSLSLNATAIEPADTRVVYTLPFSNTVVFFKDQSGDYCRELQD